MFIAGLACRPRHHSTPLLADTNTLSHGSQSQITAVHLSKGICQFVVVVGGGGGSGGGVLVVVFIAGLACQPCDYSPPLLADTTTPSHSSRSEIKAVDLSGDLSVCCCGGGGVNVLVVVLMSWWWC